MKDSISYSFLKNQYVIVCDNSEMDYKNKEIVQANGHIYLSMKGNKGLSYAYNRALDYIQSMYPEMTGRLCLFDDDTILSNDYFKKMEESHADICLPIVKDQDTLLSPSMFKNGKSIRLKSLNQLDVSYISGINSGMCINLSLFQSYRYNENLFLDYVDHYFLYTMKDKSIEVVNTTLQQSFSATTNSKESDRIRFQIFKKDTKVFYKLIHKNYRKTLYKRMLRLWIKYRDVSMFKEKI
ncbi:glycosyltransferase [Floccifex sp.]|uniref:glycosyltransferase n=1 Tax=Floccifex sp. TaxID=2815810 RepID=UPI003F050FF4